MPAPPACWCCRPRAKLRSTGSSGSACGPAPPGGRAGSPGGRAGSPGGPAGSPDPHPEDDALYEALREDGRAGYAQLAAAASISPTRTARRLETLLATGQAYVHVDLATDLLG